METFDINDLFSIHSFALLFNFLLVWLMLWVFYSITSRFSLSIRITAVILYIMIAAITNVPAQNFYFAGIERLFTIGVQIFFSTLLLSFIVRKKALVGFVLVLALHTAMDFTLPVIGSLFGQLWLSELLLAVFSIGCIVFLVRRRATLFPAQTEAS